MSKESKKEMSTCTKDVTAGNTTVQLLRQIRHGKVDDTETGESDEQKLLRPCSVPLSEDAKPIVMRATGCKFYMFHIILEFPGFPRLSHEHIACKLKADCTVVSLST